MHIRPMTFLGSLVAGATIGATILIATAAAEDGQFVLVQMVDRLFLVSVL